MKRAEKIDLIFLTGSLLASLAFVLGLYFLQYPSWWKWILFEETPMAWYQSILLIFSGLIAFLITSYHFVLNEKKEWLIWLMLALAFLALGIDERFALHERIRDKFLQPQGIHPRFLFWMDKGDFLLFLAMVTGLVLLPWVLKIFKDKRAKILFILAVIVASGAVITDSFSVPVELLEQHRIKEFWEEMLELTAQLLFLNAFFRSLSVRFLHQSVKL